MYPAPRYVFKERHDLLDCYWVSMDMSNAFHHLRMHPDDRIYMRFAASTGLDGADKIFEVQSMPFGEACAPWRLTKLMRIAVKRWRELGINLNVYLDDFLVFNRDP